MFDIVKQFTMSNIANVRLSLSLEVPNDDVTELVQSLYILVCSLQAVA